MIHVIVRPRAQRWIAEFLSRGSPDLAGQVRYFDYDALRRLPRWPEARVWIFSVDVHAERVHGRLVAIEQRLRDMNQRIFNAPSTALPRYELLRRLHAIGINTFQAHASLADDASRWRYPVFVRSRTDHDGSWTELLQAEEDYRCAITKEPRLSRPDAMVVEFCDTRDEQQLYCKHSVMRIGDRFVPRHMLYSDRWVTKISGTIDPVRAAEELRFIEARYIPREVIAAFDAGGVQYGRVDYGMIGDRAQIWEININPVVVPPLDRIDPLRHAAQKLSGAGVHAAFEALLTS